MSETEKVYETVKEAVIRACENEDVSQARELMRQLGFSESNESELATLRILYQYQKEQDSRIEFEWRCYDQTSPGKYFEPDMNKLELKLYENGEIKDRYSGSYED